MSRGREQECVEGKGGGVFPVEALCECLWWDMGEGEVRMRVASTPRKALQRNVDKAMRIEKEEEGNIMNSKKGMAPTKSQESK